MGDDWLTRDPESFADGDEWRDFDRDASGSARERWRRIRDDLLLYAAGITTGLMVVSAAWLLLNLVAPAPALSASSSAADAGTVIERVSHN